MKVLFNKYREIIMYLIFGVLTTIVSLLIYYLLVFTVLNPNVAIQLQFANIASWIGSIIFAYITNRIFVFRSYDSNKFIEFIKFAFSRLLTLFLDMGVMSVAVTIMHQSDKLFKIISMIIVVIVNYVLSKIIVFKKKEGQQNEENINCCSML